MNIAVILTCFNRKEKTLNCLSSLFKVISSCDVYLTDDGSKDGTSEAVKKQYPNVQIIKGKGDLFWSRGMYTAWKKALEKKYDFYLWLNDDIEVYPYFLEELLKCYQLSNTNCIVSGIIEDEKREKILYGGSDSDKKIIIPNGEPQDITFMNGNVVLVPQNVVDSIGIIDPIYHHDLGDVDYGLTARKAGIKVVSTTRPIALGYSNDFCRVRKWDTNIFNRFKKLYSPLGSNPKINFYFRKKNFNLQNATAYWIFLHIINLLPDAIIQKIWKDKYIDNRIKE